MLNPLLPIAHKSARIDKISILKLEGIIKIKFLWASQLWVGRRKEIILGYVSKNYKKKKSGTKGLKKIENLQISLTFYGLLGTYVHELAKFRF